MIVAGDRGLCGGFNANILKVANQYLQTKNTDDIELLLIGNKAHLFFKNKPYTIANVYKNLSKSLDGTIISEILDPVISDYQSSRIGKVTLFYNKFISALANEQKHVQLFPLNIETSDTDTSSDGHSDFIYEPNKLSVLTEFIKTQSDNTLLIALLNSRASEEGSRMAAMDSASENASDVIHQLTLSYNRGRQAAITTEISEIVAGAASLE